MASPASGKTRGRPERSASRKFTCPCFPDCEAPLEDCCRSACCFAPAEGAAAVEVEVEAGAQAFVALVAGALPVGELVVGALAGIELAAVGSLPVDAAPQAERAARVPGEPVTAPAYSSWLGSGAAAEV